MTTHIGASRALEAHLDVLVDAYLRAAHDGDVTALLATLTDDVVHELLAPTDGSRAARGRAEVRARALRTIANTTPEREVPLRRLYGADFVVDESVWEGRITGRLGTRVGGGRRVSHRALHIFEVRDQHISRITTYIDLDAIMQQLA